MAGPKAEELEAKARKVKAEEESGVAVDPKEKITDKEAKAIKKAKKHLLTTIEPSQLGYVKEGNSPILSGRHSRRSDKEQARLDSRNC